jgi:1,4-alpha-glucan branching enzyme
MKRKDDPNASLAGFLSRRHNPKSAVGGNSRRLEVKFGREAPQAVRIFVAGDFNNWNAWDLGLRRDGTVTWKTQLWLAPGRHARRFIVEGG